MAELPKCEMVQIDSHRKCQNFVVKFKKINLIIKFDKIDRTVEFFANHIHLIMANYLVKSLFITLSKKCG